MATRPTQRSRIEEEEDELAGSETGGRISYAASLITQGTHRFFTLTMPSDVLAETCTVDMRAEKPILGFQRRLDQRRAREIAAYIDSGFGTIPGSIVLSAQPEAELSYVRTKRTLSFKKHPRAFLILDGQHRVYGFHLAKTKRLRVPVVIYNGLPKAEEVRLFMDINTKQRPVPNELLLEIKRLAETETDEEAILRDVFDLFDQQPDSPLFGLMSPSEKRQNRISRVTFNAALKAVYSAFGDSDARRVYEVLGSYLRVWISGLRSKNALEHFTNPTVFRAIILLFPLVATRVADRYAREFTTENFGDVLHPLFLKLRKADLVRSGATHLDLSEIFRKRLEASFSIGTGAVL